MGLTLTITASTSDSQVVEPLVVNLDIFTTLNYASDPAWSADLVEVTGLGLSGTTSLHAHENEILGVDLYGTVIGDPMLGAVVFEIRPDSGLGFIGTGPVATPIPEAGALATWLLLNS